MSIVPVKSKDGQETTILAAGLFQNPIKIHAKN